MSRGKQGCLLAVVVLLALFVLGAWGLWRASGRGATAYSAVAQMASEMGDPDFAARCYEKAARGRPSDAGLRVEYGQALTGASREPEALRQYEEAVRLKPDWPSALAHLAGANTHLAHFAAAQQALDRGLKVAPRDPDLYRELGRLRAAEGKPDEAIRAYRQALDLKDDVAGVRAELGKILEKQKQTDRAVAVYTEGARRGEEDCQNRLIALGQTVPPTGAPTNPASPPTPAPSSSSSSPGSSAAFGFMGLFFAAYFVFIIFMLVIALGSLVVSLLAIYDCARRDFDDPSTRALWCLFLAFFHLIGAVVYYFVIYRKDDPPLQRKRVYGAPPPPPLTG